MAEQENTTPEYDWSTVNGQAHERLRAPKVYPVPPAIVKLAQASFDGVPLVRNGETVKDADGNEVKTHNMRHDFGAGNEKMAEAFYTHMKHAGDHTTPLSSVSAVIDPDGNGSKHVVAWKAGSRRGRQLTV